MELRLTLDIAIIRREMKSDFITAHCGGWQDEENPTDLELKNSIKDEINSGLRYLGISEDMFEIIES